MEDLYSTFGQARPSRYLVESDSEESDLDEQDDLKRRTRLQRRNKVTAPRLRFNGTISNSENRNLVIVTQDVEIWTTGLRNFSESDRLMSGAEQIGNLSKSKNCDILLLSTSQLPLDQLNAVGRMIVAAIKPKEIQIIASYSADSYLPSSAQQCIRTLETENYQRTKSTAKYDVPNLVTDIPAALLSIAVEKGIPAQLVLIPSSRSSVGLNQSRPDGVYDPVPANNTRSNLDPIQIDALQRYGPLQEAWQSTLDWNSSASQRTTTPDPWQWAKAAKKLRETQKRQQNESMYM